MNQVTLKQPDLPVAPLPKVPVAPGKVPSCRWASLLVVATLAVQAGLLAWGAKVHSPTLNEPGHLASGLAIWQFGRFDIYRVNPPLVRAWAALPVLAAGPRTDWRRLRDDPPYRQEFILGEDLVAANGRSAPGLFTLARWACIPFALLGGWICYVWGRALYGPTAGLLATVLWAFCPNVLGHGQLITSDVACASLALAACYLFWHWLRVPDWPHALASGAVLGLAELAKSTLVIFFLLWPLIWLIDRCAGRRNQLSTPWLRELSMLAARLVVALYVLNLGYLFDGSFTRLRDYQFVSATLGGHADQQPNITTGNRFAGSLLGALPVPLPRDYVLGIDRQKRDFEDYRQPSYLAGKFRSRGWWYFYLYALAIKVPLGTWALLALACLAGWFGKVPARHLDEFVLLCPAVILLAFVSSQTGFSQHMRYALGVLPFAFVWIGRIATVATPRRLVGTLTSLALATSVASSLWAYPHSLSYFNALAGGPRGGPRHLIHSNVDWGQDLLKLQDWQQQHPEARPLRLAYFGFFDPQHLGIDYRAPELDAQGRARLLPGWYALSVNFVQGFPYFTWTGDGRKLRLPPNALAAFQSLEPVATIGHSIYIYYIDEEPRPPAALGHTGDSPACPGARASALGHARPRRTVGRAGPAGTWPGATSLASSVRAERRPRWRRGA